MFDRKVKLLLLIVNRLGIEINYEVISKYSEKYDSINSEYHLKTWYKKITVDDKGEEVIKYYCKDNKFNRIDQVVKYLIAIKEDREKRGKGNAKAGQT